MVLVLSVMVLWLSLSLLEKLKCSPEAEVWLVVDIELSFDGFGGFSYPSFEILIPSWWEMLKRALWVLILIFANVLSEREGYCPSLTSDKEVNPILVSSVSLAAFSSRLDLQGCCGRGTASQLERLMVRWCSKVSFIDLRESLHLRPVAELECLTVGREEGFEFEEIVLFVGVLECGRAWSEIRNSQKGLILSERSRGKA
jgi:hypothetical protein